MPKKTKYTRETVIEAGLEQLKEFGWEGITPKLVAKKLGASTMPIFSHFATMDELKEAILDRAWEILTEYALKTYTGAPWVDHAIGYIFFAKDHGLLFNCMNYGKPEDVHKRRYAFWLSVYKELGEDYPAFKGMNAELVGWIRIVRAQLSHGIATALSSGTAPAWSNEDVVKQMMSLCSEIICKGFSEREEEVIKASANLTPELRKKISFMSLTGLSKKT
ncbi:hypothetical protein QUF70_11050 [Desulfobacterales bacterium HSG17]|nr:hypothetical protein [Desulfobacterales bacterium HSG17]